MLPRIDGGELGLVYTVFSYEGHTLCSTRTGSYAVDQQWLRTHPHVWEDEGSEEGEEGEDEEEEGKLALGLKGVKL